MQIIKKNLKPLTFDITNNVSGTAGNHSVVANCTIPAEYQGLRVIATAHVCGGGASGDSSSYWSRWSSGGLGSQERASFPINGGRWAFSVTDVFTLPATLDFGFRSESTGWTTSNSTTWGRPIITFTVID